MKPLLCFLLLLCAAWPGDARTRHRKSATHAGTTGRFDFYLFTLSWSPEYCQGHAGNAQCTANKPFAFVVHGLWPEYTSGGGPENCGTAPGLQNPSQMLDIMPDLHLIDHEWTTHGTCSGLSADGYFADIRKAWNALKIPAKYQAPTQQFTTNPTQVAQDFSQANLKLPTNAVEVSCPSNYLSAVEICLDKGLNAMSCPTKPPCRAQSVTVPPVR